MSLAANVSVMLQSVLQQLALKSINVLPGIVASLVVLLVGYTIGAVLGGTLKKILDMTQLCEKCIRKADLARFVGKLNLNKFFGTILKWWIFILFMPPAADLIRLYTLSSFLESLAQWVPQFIVALVLSLAGLIVAEYVAVQIRDVRAKGTATMAAIAKTVLLIFVFILALEQIGVNVSFAGNVFLVILGGIMLGIALMIGIGFGLAMKDEAKGLIRQARKRWF